MGSRNEMPGADEETGDVVVPTVRITGLVFDSAGADPHPDHALCALRHPARPGGYNLEVRFR